MLFFRFTINRMLHTLYRRWWWWYVVVIRGTFTNSTRPTVVVVVVYSAGLFLTLFYHHSVTLVFISLVRRLQLRFETFIILSKTVFSSHSNTILGALNNFVYKRENNDKYPLYPSLPLDFSPSSIIFSSLIAFTFS